VSALAAVRDLFPEGSTIECVQNSYIPRRAGCRLVVTKAGATYREGLLDGSEQFRLRLPARARDIMAFSPDERCITYLIGREMHTATWREVEAEGGGS
jgi:hypothetical protein